MAAKKVVQYQEMNKLEKCWFGNTKEEAVEIEIELEEWKVKGVKKSVWKAEVKKQVRAAFKRQLNVKLANKKLRFLKVQGVDSYIQEERQIDVRRAMKIRLNMEEYIADNYGKKQDCTLCNNTDNTEHVFICKKLPNHNNVSTDDMEKGEKMEEIVELFEIMEGKRREVIINNLFEQLDIT